MNWRWPEDREAGYVPWFVVGWRLIWTPLYYVGISFSWVMFALMYWSVKEANDLFWDLW